MNNTVTSVWTPEDEARLHELQNRRERIMDERLGDLKTELRKLSTVQALYITAPGEVELIASEMTANADALIKALQPFASRGAT